MEPKYFALEELLYSKKALDNKIQNNPSWQAVENLKKLVENILDPLRAKLGSAITVTSGFRSKKLNDFVKGAANSQHIYGEAADITAKNNRILFDTAKAMIDSGEIEVGQLINEYNYSWIHISLPNEKHRNEILEIS